MSSFQSNGPLSNPLYSAATGTTSSDGFITVFMTRDPTSNDTSYPIGKRWVNTNGSEFILRSFNASNGVTTANWIQITATGTPIEEINVPNGTTPVVPNGSGQITFSTASNDSIIITGGASSIRFEVNNDITNNTFTPTLTFGGANTGMTFNAGATFGIHLQIGKLVYIYGQIVLTAKGSSTGNARIRPTNVNDLPTCNTSFPAYLNFSMDAGITLTALYTSVYCFMNSGQVNMLPYQQGSGQTSLQLTDVEFSNTSAFQFAGTYLSN